MTLKQAAELLGLHPDHLRRQIHRGKLTAHKVGRDWLVEPEEVQRYRREHMRP